MIPAAIIAVVAVVGGFLICGHLINTEPAGDSRTLAVRAPLGMPGMPDWRLTEPVQTQILPQPRHGRKLPAELGDDSPRNYCPAEMAYPAATTKGNHR